MYFGDFPLTFNRCWYIRSEGGECVENGNKKKTYFLEIAVLVAGHICAVRR
jgi:hypothetical protein